MEYLQHCSTGTWCAAVCQNPKPYPYPWYPFWKHCRYSHTCFKPYLLCSLEFLWQWLNLQWLCVGHISSPSTRCRGISCAEGRWENYSRLWQCLGRQPVYSLGKK